MSKIDTYYKKMTETPVYKLILKLGIPTTISMLITNIYNLADTYFLGTLDESAQASTGILFTLQAIIQAIAFMLGHGSGTYCAKALAEKDTKTATTYVSTAFFTGFLMGVLIIIFGFIFFEPMLWALGSTESILPHAKDYGLWVLISCPFMITSLILNNNLRYEGIAMFSMIGLTFGGVLNILGDYILVIKLGMGVFGAGLATAVSQMVSFVILLVLYILKAQGSLKIRAVSFNKIVFINILKGGLPSLIRQGFNSISNGILNNMTKPFGDAAIAAITIVHRYTSFVLAIGIGIGQGFQPVASFNYSAGKIKRVKKGLLFTWIFSTIVVGVISLFGIFFSSNIVRIFQEAPEVIEIGSLALKFSSVGLIFLSSSTSANMLFQSIRRAKLASFLALLRSGLVFLPAVIILQNLFGLFGVQSSQGIADVLSGLISIPFMIHFLKNEKDDNDFLDTTPKGEVDNLNDKEKKQQLFKKTNKKTL